jgi:L-threonylcarbamoyladenylate synthase
MSRDGPGVPEAVRLIQAGEAVAFPTETVYGLGADAANPRAVAKIFAIKGRPADHPLIVHLGKGARIDDWAVDIPASARILAERFWPGPLTLILRKSGRVPPEVTGGQATVAVRFPAHPVARALLEEFARVGSGGIAAPSANRFGHVSPTTAQHVRDELGPEIFILDGGDCEIGLESTIVDLSRGPAVLLRPGGVARADIALALGEPLRDRDEQAPRASGTLASHYAPETVLALLDTDALAREVAAPASVAVLALSDPPPAARVTSWITASADAVAYGHDLYANLRKLDASGAKRILVEAPPATPAWEAINDRLVRAAAGAGAMDDEP